MLADSPNGSASSMGSYGSKRWLFMPLKTCPPSLGASAAGHVVRGREVLLGEGAGPCGLVARVVVVVGVCLFLVLLLCNTKSA
jgi:hypothetical protein